MLNLKAMKIIVLIILCLIPVGGFAQEKIDLSAADLLAYNKHGEVNFYQKLAEDKFQEIILRFVDHSKSNFLTYHMEDSNRIETLHQIEKKYERLIYVKDLKASDSENLFSNSWEITISKQKKQILNNFNSGLATIQEIYFGKKESDLGLGAAYVERENDDVEKWRVSNAKIYALIDLQLGNDKHIFLVNRGRYTDFIFLPLMDGNYLVSDDGKINKLIPTPKKKTNYVETFSDFDFEDYYTLAKTENNKYQLLDPFKKNLLKSDYDTIVYNQFFIIAQENNAYEIFNSFYENIKFKDIKTAYLFRTGLEVLDKNGANYYTNHRDIV